MAEAFLGEIRIFAGNYAPLYWEFCAGQLIPISGNETLYSLLGITYGGDGRSTFALPDMRGRIPVGDGQGIGLTSRFRGHMFGYEMQNISNVNIPSHKHQLQACLDAASTNIPNNNIMANTGNLSFYEDIDGDESIGPLPDESVVVAGGGQPHNNVMPSIVLNFIICVNNGEYPSRN